MTKQKFKKWGGERGKGTHEKGRKGRKTAREMPRNGRMKLSWQCHLNFGTYLLLELPTLHPSFMRVGLVFFYKLDWSEDLGDKPERFIIFHRFAWFSNFILFSSNFYMKCLDFHLICLRQTKQQLGLEKNLKYLRFSLSSIFFLLKTCLASWVCRDFW